MTVSILFSSRCFLAIIKGDPSNPTNSIVRRWLRGIHESTGIQVHYSPVTHQMLVNKAKYINATSRRLMKVGGRQGKQFLDKVWTVALPLRDVVEAVIKENVDLKTQLGEAREEGIPFNKENIDLKAQLVAVTEEGIALRKSNHSLKSQVTFLSERNVEEVSGIERRRTNCEVDCSDRHLRRIKKRRTTA